MCLSLLVFTQLFSEVSQSQPAKPAKKQNLTRNTQSRSFKVTHFGITEKATTDCISPCNNTGLISKVSEKIAIETAKNCRCRRVQTYPTTVVWHQLPGEPPQIFAHILHRQKLESLAYIFAGDSVGLSSFKFWQRWQSDLCSFVSLSKKLPLESFYRAPAYVRQIC